ncbi:MAG: histidinol-phosphate transaminase [Pseudomonadales bacterium]|nr:histidinol-phosphate transaminase [Pseudomonadales bacterium]
MSKYWSKLVTQLEPYIPGEQPQDQQYIKLNTNENPYPPSPKVLTAIKAAVNDSLKLYPDPNSVDLKQAIAKYYNVAIEEVFVANGSDEVLAVAFQAFFKNQSPSSNPLLFPDISYSFYDAYCKLYEIEPGRIPLEKNLSINLNKYSQKNGGVIFPNPNAPTGKALPLSEIESYLNKNDKTVVIVDEAYVDFGADSVIPLISKYPNLLSIQTFSKSRSLAGSRIGFAVGNKDLIEALERVKNSYNSYTLDKLALVAGTEAIKDTEYFQQTVSTIIQTRESTSKRLTALGFNLIPSSTNFVFAQHNSINAETLYLELKSQGILVRYFKRDRIDNYLRITIGTQNEMNTFLQRLDDIIKNLSQD